MHRKHTKESGLPLRPWKGGGDVYCPSCLLPPGSVGSASDVSFFALCFFSFSLSLSVSLAHTYTSVYTYSPFMLAVWNDRVLYNLALKSCLNAVLLALNVLLSLCPGTSSHSHLDVAFLKSIVLLSDRVVFWHLCALTPLVCPTLPVLLIWYWRARNITLPGACQRIRYSLTDCRREEPNEWKVGNCREGKPQNVG